MPQVFGGIREGVLHYVLNTKIIENPLTMPFDLGYLKQQVKLPIDFVPKRIRRAKNGSYRLLLSHRRGCHSRTLKAGIQ